ncbi:MAG TPA: hypothetical protein VM305_00625 [Candidatus Limnocylindrales bacterium]|nr:hypothetical protein [Candidatus Limnocylindrales bacterium]
MTDHRSGRDRPLADQPETSEFVTLDRQRALKAFDWGLLAMLGVGFAYGVLTYPVELEWGLIAVAIGGGWIIGRAINHGAWQGRPHPRNWSLRILAVVLAIVAWLVGMFVSYVFGQLLLEGATQPLLERISPAGFSEYMAQVYAIHHGIAMAALAIMAWRTTR